MKKDVTLRRGGGGGGGEGMSRPALRGWRENVASQPLSGFA